LATTRVATLGTHWVPTHTNRPTEHKEARPHSNGAKAHTRQVRWEFRQRSRRPLHRRGPPRPRHPRATAHGQSPTRRRHVQRHRHIAGPKVAVALLPTLLQAVHGSARARLCAPKTDEAAPPLDVLRVGGEGWGSLNLTSPTSRLPPCPGLASAASSPRQGGGPGAGPRLPNSPEGAQLVTALMSGALHPRAVSSSGRALRSERPGPIVHVA
jgi:hypothetical protein